MIFAEYHLMRHVIKLRDRRSANSNELKDWHTRLRKMGSAISSARMSLRLINWLEAVKFLIV